jgi:hypothetical protein
MSGILRHRTVGEQCGRGSWAGWLSRAVVPILLGIGATLGAAALGYHHFLQRLNGTSALRAAGPSGQFDDPAHRTWQWNLSKYGAATWGQFLDVTQRLPAMKGAQPRTAPLGSANTAWSRIFHLSASHVHNFGAINWVEVGWPFRALGGTHAEFTDRAHVAGGETLEGLSLDSPSLPQWLQDRLGSRTSATAMLPTGVRWNGLLGDITFWSFLAALLLSAPRAARHLRRRRYASRGLCLSCGYPLAALPSCPECGRPRNAES